MQYAVASKQTPPIPELTNLSWWANYASDKHYSGTRYVTPLVEEGEISLASGERMRPIQRITGFVETAAAVKRSWFVSLEEIESSGNYSLCADTYREPIDERKRTGQRQKTRERTFMAPDTPCQFSEMISER
jgi:hypothetical protein